MLIAMAVICLVFGIWIFADPDPISKFIPYVISILLIVHGATTIGAAANGKAIGMDDWGLLMLLGILSVVACPLCSYTAKYHTPPKIPSSTRKDVT